MAVKADSLQCENRTLALCENYISDTKWHWAQVLTINSYDQILTYSTSDSLHYDQVVTKLTRRSVLIGERAYNDIGYEIYQLPNRRVLELNQHRNKEGLMFYMMNLIKG